MATPSTLDRSPSDFSDASIISLGRSTHADVDACSERTPLLGISVQSQQVESSQGITAVNVNELITLLAVCYVLQCSFSFLLLRNISELLCWNPLRGTLIFAVVMYV